MTDEGPMRPYENNFEKKKLLHMATQAYDDTQGKDLDILNAMIEKFIKDRK